MIDHLDIIKKRLASQYRNAPNLNAYIESILAFSNEIEDAINDTIDLRWIDTAVGAQLDILGEIVGQKREVLDISQLKFFGFDGALGADTFGTLSDPSIGSRFRSVDEATTGNVILSDPEYRVFIRARILKNFTDGTIEDVIEAVSLVLDVDDVFVQNSGTASATITIGRLLTDNEKLLLLNTDIIVRPAGVSYAYQEYEGTPFGFYGLAIAGGFSSLSDPLSGGKFVTLI